MTRPALVETFWLAKSPRPADSFCNEPLLAVVMFCLEVPLISMVPALLARFCIAVLPALDLLVTLTLVRLAVCREVAPAAMVIAPGEVG